MYNLKLTEIRYEVLKLKLKVFDGNNEKRISLSVNEN